MKKSLLMAAFVASLAFPALRTPAAAETAEAPAPQQLSVEDRAALVDARIAALKTGLKLSPAQLKDWDSLEAVLRDVVKTRVARKTEAREKANAFHDKDEVIQLMNVGAADLIARGEELQKVAKAATPLFDSFDAAQKHRFALLLRTFAGPAFQK